MPRENPEGCIEMIAELPSPLLKHVTGLAFETNCSWEALHLLEKRIFTYIIPRLVGALERRDGRIVKACLIKGIFGRETQGLHMRLEFKSFSES